MSFTQRRVRGQVAFLTSLARSGDARHRIWRTPVVRLSLAARAIGVTAALTVAVAACGSDNNTASNVSKDTNGCASGSLSGQGSTFQQNIEKQWSSDFA